ncbi:MAG: M48 family metallopeptidase [Candidatus Acidiferrum sp.]
MRAHTRLTTATTLALLLLSSNALADRTNLKPGINAFTPQQDIQLGRKAAHEVEQKLPLCNDPKVDAYLTKLGQRLIAHLNTRGVDYPWEFHCVNDKAVNAFALPGGFVFINRGAIEAADNEAQLAAIMAHELSHVALRHGTNQATKAQYAELGAGIMGAAGGIFGGAAGAAAAGAGQLTFGSVLLHNSRGAETQADVMGTQVLYDAGFDPRAMAAFFENLNASSAGGKAPPEFFSDHPNPDHRIERVDTEIRKLGGAPEGAEKDSLEFEAIKREVMALPAPVKPKPATNSRSSGAGGVNAPVEIPKPTDPSPDVTRLRYSKASLTYPINWKNYTRKNSVVVVPVGGIVDAGNGQGILAWGMIGGIAQVKGKSKGSPDALRDETQKVIAVLQKENESMEVDKPPADTTVDGSQALSTYLRNDSPAGGTETDWLVTVIAPQGLYYYVFVSPTEDFPRFQPAFQQILTSVQFQ